MKPISVSRRVAVKALGAAGAGFVLSGRAWGQTTGIRIGGVPVDITIGPAPTWSGQPNPHIVRIGIRPIVDGRVVPLPDHRIVAGPAESSRPATSRSDRDLARVRVGDMVVRYQAEPTTLLVETAAGEPVQRVTFDPESGVVRFLLPKGPLFGFGEGGAGFDRQGTIDPMRNGQTSFTAPAGQGGYSLRTHGARAAIPWFVATDGWGLYFHQALGTFDLTGESGVFTPRTPGGSYDLFVVAADEPALLMRAWADISGYAEMPPLWSFGYLQSSRTLAGPEEIRTVARTFREKQLPCDGLIFLGTEFTPSGWNTRNGEFDWKPENFPNPKGMLDELHALDYKVVLHIVVEGRVFTGTVGDACTAPLVPPGRTEDGRWPQERQVACYWPAHKPLSDLGVDGWWPDQGDGYDPPSRLARIRMYWEGAQQWRPNIRPFALHRNGQAGMQRFGAFLWSGDVFSFWETLRLHIPIAINTALSGIPYWGTDIGGFVPTREYTGELHVRWFQFGAFNPLFRAHGRNWHLRLPWGWNTGTMPPSEIRRETPDAADPDPAELRNPLVEPICRKYLELRYQLMPYLYSRVRECAATGMPILRALWLHYPDDPQAVARGDEFLWGRDMLIAPVVERGATTRRVYLPRGSWYDFWTNEVLEGGREIVRNVDLATMPIYVRVGAILPSTPVAQTTQGLLGQPLIFTVYPGAAGSASLFEDDGRSFDFKRGRWLGITATWDDPAKRLTLRQTPGSETPATPRPITVQLPGAAAPQSGTWTGRELRFTFGESGLR